MTDNRVPTGVEGLDDLIGGGFLQGKSYLISGETCAIKTCMDKTLFCLQFLMKGLELGESGVYITVDETPGNLIEDSNFYGFGIAEGVDQKRISILDYSARFEQIIENGTEIDIWEIFKDINRHITQINARRLVIDPIAPFAIRDGRLWKVRSCIRAIFYALDRLGTTTLLGSIIPAGTDSLSQFGVEEFYASGVVVLSTAKMENIMRSRRIMIVRKMRGLTHTLEPYVYGVEHGKGIVIQHRLAEDYEI